MNSGLVENREPEENPMRTHARLAALLAVALVGGVGCGSDPMRTSLWQPKPWTEWQIQFRGRIDTTLNVDAFEVDLFDTPLADIKRLRENETKVICYFSAGTYEDWRPDSGLFSAALLGEPLPSWPGERWLDIRQLDALLPLLRQRLDLAVQKGCDGIDADNVNGYTNATGFPLTADYQLRFNRALASEAHARLLAIGLKNDLNQVPDLVTTFDFAVNESCVALGECDTLKPFIAIGKPVFGIEYQGTFDTVCPVANAHGFDTLIKNRSLDSYRVACR